MFKNKTNKSKTEENSFFTSKASQNNSLQTKRFGIEHQNNKTNSLAKVQRQLQRAVESGFDFAQVGISQPKNVQKKTTMGEVGDIYEQDADFAGANFSESLQQNKSVQRNENEEDEMMMKADSSLQRNENEEDEMMMKADSSLQRNENEEEMLMGDGGLSLGGGEVSEQFESALNQEKQTGGESLSVANQKAVQTHMNSEPGNIKIHTGENANQLCQQARARAMTVGNHIMYANKSDYSQNIQGASKDKQELFGHEYKHTEHQGASRPRRNTI